MAREADLGRGTGAPRPAGDAQPREGAPPRGGMFNFIHESIAELKKVEWPGQSQVIQGTVVVLVACIIVGTYLWLNDQIWQEIVKKVLI
ncbi:MAG TPA: preprotein translocase subunit SecE [Gaiellaceae bacterium]